MPSKTPAQRRLMAAVAHGWHPDRIKGPPVSVAKDFVAADKRKRIGKKAGGTVPMGTLARAPGRVDTRPGTLQRMARQRMGVGAASKGSTLNSRRII